MGARPKVESLAQAVAFGAVVALEHRVEPSPEHRVVQRVEPFRVVLVVASWGFAALEVDLESLNSSNRLYCFRLVVHLENLAYVVVAALVVLVAAFAVDLEILAFGVAALVAFPALAVAGLDQQTPVEPLPVVGFRRGTNRKPSNQLPLDSPDHSFFRSWCFFPGTKPTD